MSSSLPRSSPETSRLHTETDITVPLVHVGALRFRLGQIASRQFPYGIHVLDTDGIPANQMNQHIMNFDGADMASVCLPISEQTLNFMQLQQQSGRVILPTRMVHSVGDLHVNPKLQYDTKSTLLVIDATSDQGLDGRLLRGLREIQNPVAVHIDKETPTKRVECIVQQLTSDRYGIGTDAEGYDFTDRLIVAPRITNHREIKAVKERLSVVRSTAGRCATLASCSQPHRKPTQKDNEMMQKQMRWLHEAAQGETVVEHLDGVFTLDLSGRRRAYLSDPTWNTTAIQAFQNIQKAA